MIALVRKHWPVYVTLLLLLFVGAAYTLFSSSITTLRIRNRSFTTEVVSNQSEQQLGLSGRSGIAGDAAMVFAYPVAEKRCFWMKDMRFSIDMVWLDAGRKVVAVEPNVSPDTYPKNYCHENARYVVEFATGTTQRLHVQVGDQVTL